MKPAQNPEPESGKKPKSFFQGYPKHGLLYYMALYVTFNRVKLTGLTGLTINSQFLKYISGQYTVPFSLTIQ